MIDKLTAISDAGLKKALNGAVSVLALSITTAAPAAAQTDINDGDNVTVTSLNEDETISAIAGVTSEVSGGDVVIFNNNNVTLNNAGTLRALGAGTNTVRVNDATVGGVVNNAATGRLEGASRVVDIQGDDFTLNNEGTILGVGDQRNGAVYANRTANNFTINNIGAASVIDAGLGNNGAGVSIEVGGGGGPITGSITNEGLIQGRGQIASPDNTAGDGIRFFGPGLAPTYNFAGDITNSGTIASESAVGPVSGIRFNDNIQFTGTLTNESSGVISGVNNGLYFGDADHAGGAVNNAGLISSGSRALNIDGSSLVINNSGQILGKGNQRNGAVYADSTAQNFTLNNLDGGVIDAGAGFEGAGFSVELSDSGNDFTIDNAGTIQGRGNAGAGLGTAGDGLRFERTRVGGALDGTTSGLFTGDIVNSGVIDSEAANGTAAGIRFVNGVSFNGTIDNSGTISGVQNGLYFGNATPAGGGDFTGAVVNNSGTISSGSRALNIDGLGLEVNNSGQILGTGDQRNGTVYADATANAYTFNNLASGVVDAGVGNNGSGVSLQSGDVDGETVTLSLDNAGLIAGRGDALASGAAAGLRVFNGAANVNVDGSINNSGDITSETAAAILIENVNFTGALTNSGNLTGASAFDASTALSGVSFTQTGGSLNGDFIGSAFADTLTFASGSSTLAGSVVGGVDVTVADGAAVSVLGAQSLDGDLVSNGVLGFTLGAGSLAVDGNVTLGAGSVINVSTPNDITALPLGSSITVLSETGAFTDNGVTVNIIDTDFLVDYAATLGSLSITSAAVDLAAVSGDANVTAFGGVLTSAFVGGVLDADVANFLNSSADAAAFETNALSLLPAINEGVTREIYETQDLANALIDNRLRSEGNGLWGQFLYRTADRDAEGVGVVGYDADAFGLAIGYDRQFSEAVKAGLSFNYANIDISSDNRQEADIDAFQVSAYAGYEEGPWFANGIVGYSFNNVDAERATQVGPITSDSDVDGFNVRGVVGYDLASGEARIAPIAGVQYARLSQDEYTENGGLNLRVDPEDVGFLELRAGVEASTNVEKGDWNVRPLARATYVYDVFGDDARVFNAALESGAPFVLQTTGAAQSRFEVGAGLELNNASGVALSIEYDGEFADGYTSNGGFLRARFNF